MLILCPSYFITTVINETLRHKFHPYFTFERLSGGQVAHVLGVLNRVSLQTRHTTVFETKM